MTESGACHDGERHRADGSHRPAVQGAGGENEARAIIARLSSRKPIGTRAWATCSTRTNGSPRIWAGDPACYGQRAGAEADNVEASEGGLVGRR
jgi:hypothetical protein